MAKLVTLVEQHLDKQLPTVAIQATSWWEAVHAHVKLQECGLGMHLPVKVGCLYTICMPVHSGGKCLVLSSHQNKLEELHMAYKHKKKQKTKKNITLYTE